MAAITKRRDGKGYEREIQALTRLRTAIVIETRIDLETHTRMLDEIDALIRSLSDLIRRNLNAADSTPPPPMAAGEGTVIEQINRKS